MAKWRSIGLLFFSVAAIILAGCADDRNDDQSGTCGKTIEIDQTRDVSQKIAVPQAQDYEDCIPAEVAAQSGAKELFLSMMEFYLGDYRDELGNVYTLQCTQEGTWSMPGKTPEGARCAGGWGMPIWVVSEEQDIQVPGQILLGGGEVETSGANLDFCLPNNDCRFGYHQKDENGKAWKWIFYEDNGEWVKE